jgi:hypothetical protein
MHERVHSLAALQSIVGHAPAPQLTTHGTPGGHTMSPHVALVHSKKHCDATQ